MSVPASDNSSANGILTGMLGTLILGIVLLATGVINPFGPGDDTEPDDDVDVVEAGDIEEQAQESKIEACKLEAENLRDIAKQLRAKKFKSVRESLVALDKLNATSGQDAWSTFGDAMSDADKAKRDGFKDAADYMESTADGLDLLVKQFPKRRR